MKNSYYTSITYISIIQYATQFGTQKHFGNVHDAHHAKMQ